MRKPKTYDRFVTVFSPEGRLYQVEYAMELVNRGAPIVGVSSQEGAILAAIKTYDSRLEDPEYFRKIFQLDEHIGAGVAGFAPDARVLIKRARLLCQSNRLLYDEALDVRLLTRKIGNIVQVYTQYARARPFGVNMIIAGVDNTGPQILNTDPSGSCHGYKAKAAGRKNEQANKLLEKRYNEGITLDEAITLAIDALKGASEDEITSEVIEAAVIPADTKRFRRLTDKEVGKHIK